MLQLVESNISRRVVLHKGDGPGILCWIFNPDVYYSSSKRGAMVYRAMKIFYKEVDDPLKLLDEHSTTLEELALPETEFHSVQQTLEDVKDILPASARTFQDWQVGLIDRHEATPSGLGAMDNNALNHPAPESIELFKLPAGWASLYE
jgi:ubiquitin-protein ligase E3 D